MTQEPTLDRRSEDALLAAEVLLHRLFPSTPYLSPSEIHLLTLQAGVWALKVETEAHRRELPQLLSRQLMAFHQLPGSKLAAGESLPTSLPKGELLEVRRRCEAFGQPWALKNSVRNNVTQTSYRVYPALLNKVQAIQLPGERPSDYHLQITLALAYLALPRLRARVNSLLRLRYNASSDGAELKRSPEAMRVAAALQESGLPWRGRVTLRRPVRQVAMRVTTALAAALKTAPPAELRCTIADLHTTLLALYLTDEELRAHVRTLLLARTQA